jgi:hypothetical protein
MIAALSWQRTASRQWVPAVKIAASAFEGMTWVFRLRAVDDLEGETHWLSGFSGVS